jgi:hypothetical protein
VKNIHDEIIALRAENAELRKDKARLEGAWEAARSYIDNYETDPTTPQMWRAYDAYAAKRDAIDAAMEEGK